MATTHKAVTQDAQKSRMNFSPMLEIYNMFLFNRSILKSLFFCPLKLTNVSKTTLLSHLKRQLIREHTTKDRSYPTSWGFIATSFDIYFNMASFSKYPLRLPNKNGLDQFKEICLDDVKYFFWDLVMLIYGNLTYLNNREISLSEILKMTSRFLTGRWNWPWWPSSLERV